MSENIEQYISNLRSQGKTTEEIKNNLRSGGWKDSDISAVLGEVPPPPMPSSGAVPPPPLHEEGTKHSSSLIEVFVNFLSFVLLGIVAFAVGSLYFEVINKYIPDALSNTGYGYYRGGNYALHYATASLIVGFPIYIWAMWFWFKRFRNETTKRESKLTKWLTYIILLVAAGTAIGDLIAVVFRFLQGELGARFLLKALTVLVIALFVFGFYILERKRIQYKKHVSSGLLKILGWVAFVIVAVGIILAFVATGSPKQERMRKFDVERVQGLSNLASGIQSFAWDRDRLPKDLEELESSPGYWYESEDPETGDPYEYRIVSEPGVLGGTAFFELCATFSLPAEEINVRNYYNRDKLWSDHNAGRVCREYNVDIDSNTTNQGILEEVEPVVPIHLDTQ